MGQRATATAAPPPRPPAAPASPTTVSHHTTVLLSGVDVADIGRTAYAILKGGEQGIGHTAGLAGDQLTGAQYAQKLGAAIGEPVSVQAVPYDVFRTLGFPGADEIGNMFQQWRLRPGVHRRP